MVNYMSFLPKFTWSPCEKGCCMQNLPFPPLWLIWEQWGWCVGRFRVSGGCRIGHYHRSDLTKNPEKMMIQHQCLAFRHWTGSVQHHQHRLPVCQAIQNRHKNLNQCRTLHQKQNSVQVPGITDYWFWVHLWFQWFPVNLRSKVYTRRVLLH